MIRQDPPPTNPELPITSTASMTVASPPSLASVPVVLLGCPGSAGLSSPSGRAVSYRQGADACLPFPYEMEELLVVIDGVVRGREAVLGKLLRDRKDKGVVVGGENGKDDGNVEYDENGDNIGELIHEIREIRKMVLSRGGGRLLRGTERSRKRGGQVLANIDRNEVGNSHVQRRETSPERRVVLTPSETDVLALMCRGLMNKEIANLTGRSVRRVEQHLTSMYRKTRLLNRTELARWALTSGIVVD